MLMENSIIKECNVKNGDLLHFCLDQEQINYFYKSIKDLSRKQVERIMPILGDDL